MENDHTHYGWLVCLTSVTLVAFRIGKEQLRRRRHDGISYYVRGQRQESTPSAVPALPCICYRTGRKRRRSYDRVYICSEPPPGRSIATEPLRRRPAANGLAAVERIGIAFTIQSIGVIVFNYAQPDAICRLSRLLHRGGITFHSIRLSDWVVQILNATYKIHNMQTFLLVYIFVDLCFFKSVFFSTI